MSQAVYSAERLLIKGSWVKSSNRTVYSTEGFVEIGQFWGFSRVFTLHPFPHSNELSACCWFQCKKYSRFIHSVFRHVKRGINHLPFFCDCIIKCFTNKVEPLQALLLELGLPAEAVLPVTSTVEHCVVFCTRATTANVLSTDYTPEKNIETRKWQCCRSQTGVKLYGIPFCVMLLSLVGP